MGYATTGGLVAVPRAVPLDDPERLDGIVLTAGSAGVSRDDARPLDRLDQALVLAWSYAGARPTDAFFVAD